MVSYSSSDISKSTEVQAYHIELKRLFEVPAPQEERQALKPVFTEPESTNKINYKMYYIKKLIHTSYLDGKLSGGELILFSLHGATLALLA